MRGAIYFMRLPDQHTTMPHSVERGHRPVVVVSSDIGNRTSNICMVCPLTTKVKNLSCNVDIAWCKDKPSQVLCNQIMTVPQSELGRIVGFISLEEQERVDRALCVSLGIKVR